MSTTAHSLSPLCGLCGLCDLRGSTPINGNWGWNRTFGDYYLTHQTDDNASYVDWGPAENFRPNRITAADYGELQHTFVGSAFTLLGNVDHRQYELDSPIVGQNPFYNVEYPMTPFFRPEEPNDVFEGYWGGLPGKDTNHSTAVVYGYNFVRQDMHKVAAWW